MNTELIIGYLFILIAGVFSGIFSLPMKWNHKWKWEHHWIIWSIMATLILPWIIAKITVPDLMQVYQQASAIQIVIVFAFGLLWGISAISFGFGLQFMGIALGMSIMMGLINSIGAIIPFLILQPQNLFKSQGISLLIGSGIIILGLIISSIAGKQNATSKNKNSDTGANKNFVKGFIICLLAGILGPLLNLAFVYGNGIRESALHLGAQSVYAGNAIWTIALLGGFVTVTSYSLYLLFIKNKSWKEFSGVKPTGYLIALIPGILWFVSIMFYGMAANNLGTSGTSAGWSIFQSLGIIAGNVAGFATGEWRDANRKTIFINWGGIFIMLIGIFIIGFFAK